MNRYPEYKDSGVEWIGEVPSHWGIKKIKYVSKLVNGSTPKSDKENWNGEADLVIRIIDDDASYSKVAFRLVVHPINDAPILQAIGDTNMFLNNVNYPNDTHIKIEYSDIEQNKENLALDTCKQTGTVHERHKAYYVDGVLYYKGKILQSNQ